MNPNTKGMVKLLGIKKPHGLRDTDKDGVINILDCKPYNPKKQGWIHEKWKAAKEGMAERRAERKEIKTAERTAYKEASMTQATRVGTQRAKIEAEKRIKKYREKPTFGQSFIGGFSRGGSTRLATGKQLTKPQYKYVKKGKHYVRKKVGTTTERPRQQQPYSMPDINRPIFKW